MFVFQEFIAGHREQAASGGYASHDARSRPSAYSHHSEATTAYHPSASTLTYSHHGESAAYHPSSSYPGQLNSGYGSSSRFGGYGGGGYRY